MLNLANLETSFKKKYAYYQLKRYLHARKIYRYVPYSLEIYERCLKSLKESHRHQFIRFLAYEETSREKDNIFVRHDIDTKNCMRNLPSTLEIDQRLQIHAGIYLRVDDEEYSAIDYQEMFHRYKNQGFEIGLHSLCYVKDAYLKELKRETDKFRREVGFQPRSFSVHGLGSLRLEVRIKFYQEIALLFHEFGYEACDIPLTRSYEHVIHDCHLDGENRRFLYDDFIYFPSLSLKGRRYLILTHPCYWQV